MSFSTCNLELSLSWVPKTKLPLVMLSLFFTYWLFLPGVLLQATVDQFPQVPSPTTNVQFALRTAQLTTGMIWKNYLLQISEWERLDSTRFLLQCPWYHSRSCKGLIWALSYANFAQITPDNVIEIITLNWAILSFCLCVALWKCHPWSQTVLGYHRIDKAPSNRKH